MVCVKIVIFKKFSLQVIKVLKIGSTDEFAPLACISLTTYLDVLSSRRPYSGLGNSQLSLNKVNPEGRECRLNKV